MKPWLLIFVLCLLTLTGCAVTTALQTPTGDVYIVISKSDAVVSLKQGDMEIVVDNRGRPTFLEAFFSVLIMKGPDVTVGTGGEQ